MNVPPKMGELSANKPTPRTLTRKKIDRSKKTVKKNAIGPKPKRPLSVYNLFFKEERRKLLSELPNRPGGRTPRRSHGKCGFDAMAKIISEKWKNREVDSADMARLKVKAQQDTLRYQKELEIYNKQVLDAVKKSLPTTREANDPVNDIPPILGIAVASDNKHEGEAHEGEDHEDEKRNGTCSPVSLDVVPSDRITMELEHFAVFSNEGEQATTSCEHTDATPGQTMVVLHPHDRPIETGFLGVPPQGTRKGQNGATHFQELEASATKNHVLFMGYSPLTTGSNEQQGRIFSQEQKCFGSFGMAGTSSSNLLPHDSNSCVASSFLPYRVLKEADYHFSPTPIRSQESLPASLLNIRNHRAGILNGTPRMMSDINNGGGPNRSCSYPRNLQALASALGEEGVDNFIQLFLDTPSNESSCWD